MEQNAPEITLSDYWRILRKRKWTMLSVFFTVILSTVIFTKLQTPVYRASIELKIEKTEPLINLTSEAKLSVGGGTSNLATDMRLITSLPVLRKVVERMEVLPPDPAERENRLHTLSLDYQAHTGVSQINDTNIVSVNVESNDPQKAALIATAIADVYVIENVESRKKQSRALINYIDRQLEEYKERLQDEEGKLQKFNQNEKVFEVTEDVKRTLDRMTVEGSFEFESEMLNIEEQLRSLNTILNDQKIIDRFGLLDDDTSQENYLFVGLKRRLLELEFERFLLLIDYTEKHPDVVAKDAVISDVKNKIVQMLKSFSQTSISPEWETDLALLIKKLFLENRKEVLFRIVNKFYGDSGSLSTNQLEYVRLKRGVDRMLNAYDQLSKQIEDAKLEEAKVIDDVITIVSPATPPRSPIKPNARVNYLVSVVIGLLLGVIFCFLKESMDTSVATISDVKEEIGLSILGIIPHVRREDVLQHGWEEEYAAAKDKKISLQRARLVTISSPKSWPAESYKMLRTNLIRIMKTNGLKSILFTSSDKQEGKTSTVTNLVLSLAQLGKRTVLVGANMRRPTIYKIFGLNREPGLSDILMGHISWQEAINTSTDILTGGILVDDLLQMPGIDNLKIITAGRPIDNVSELLNSRAFEQLLTELKTNFDVVIIDCSPVMAVPDAITLSDKVDGLVLIYKVGTTAKDVLKMAKSNLMNANANILGIILNDIKTEAQVGYSAYYYRYYAETSEKENSRSKFREPDENPAKKNSEFLS